MVFKFFDFWAMYQSPVQWVLNQKTWPCTTTSIKGEELMPQIQSPRDAYATIWSPRREPCQSELMSSNSQCIIQHIVHSKKHRVPPNRYILLVDLGIYFRSQKSVDWFIFCDMLHDGNHELKYQASPWGGAVKPKFCTLLTHETIHNRIKSLLWCLYMQNKKYMLQSV